MEDSLISFITNWDYAMWYLSLATMVLGIIVYLVFKIKLVATFSLKGKYDFVSKYEYSFLLATHVLFASALFCICNTYKATGLSYSFLWFWIRLFISLCGGILYGYVALLMLNYYYPSRQAKKLKKYRYQTRINPKTGNQMKLLSEEEEDAYLDEGMRAEEDVFSLDYDVWIDVKTNDIQIEKYEGRLHVLECDRCGFQTLKLEKEEISKEITDTEVGELVKHYKCRYCNRVKTKTVSLSNQKSEDDFVMTEATQFVDNPLDQGPKVVAIKLTIHANNGQSRNFEFQSISQADKFLKEFELSELDEEEY